MLTLWPTAKIEALELSGVEETELNDENVDQLCQLAITWAEDLLQDQKIDELSQNVSP